MNCYKSNACKTESINYLEQIVTYSIYIYFVFLLDWSIFPDLSDTDSNILRYFTSTYFGSYIWQIKHKNI